MFNKTLAVDSAMVYSISTNTTLTVKKSVSERNSVIHNLEISCHFAVHYGSGLINSYSTCGTQKYLKEVF